MLAADGASEDRAHCQRSARLRPDAACTAKQRHRTLDKLVIDRAHPDVRAFQDFECARPDLTGA
jgi:hypothetical protein